MEQLKKYILDECVNSYYEMSQQSYIQQDRCYKNILEVRKIPTILSGDFEAAQYIYEVLREDNGKSSYDLPNQGDLNCYNRIFVVNFLWGFDILVLNKILEQYPDLSDAKQYLSHNKYSSDAYCLFDQAYVKNYSEKIISTLEEEIRQMELAKITLSHAVKQKQEVVNNLL